MPAVKPQIAFYEKYGSYGIKAFENTVKYAKLRGKIVEKFRTQSAFAKAMNINVTTLNAKLNGKSQWTADEIATACMLLDIPLSETHEYFFCEMSCIIATQMEK